MPVAAAEVLDLGAVTVAGLALLLVLGAYALSRFLTGLLRALPLVGGWIADHLLEHVNDALSASADWLKSEVGALVGFAWRPVAWGIQLAWDVADGFLAVNAFAVRLMTSTLPSLEVRAIGYAAARYWDAVTYTDSAVASSFAQAWHGITTLATTVDGELVRLRNWALGDVNALREWTAAQLTADVAWAGGQFVAAYAYIDATAVRVTGWAGAELDALRRWAESEFAGARAWVRSEVGVIEGDLAAGVAAAEAEAARLADLAQAAGIAAAGVVAADLARYLEECGNDLCGGLHGLSRLLPVLGELVEGVAFLTLLEEAARDAPALAREVTAVMGPIVDGAATVVRDAVGVAA